MTINLVWLFPLLVLVFMYGCMRFFIGRFADFIMGQKFVEGDAGVASLLLCCCIVGINAAFMGVEEVKVNSLMDRIEVLEQDAQQETRKPTSPLRRPNGSLGNLPEAGDIVK